MLDDLAIMRNVERDRIDRMLKDVIDVAVFRTTDRVHNMLAELQLELVRLSLRRAKASDEKRALKRGARPPSVAPHSMPSAPVAGGKRSVYVSLSL